MTTGIYKVEKIYSALAPEILEGAKRQAQIELDRQLIRLSYDGRAYNVERYYMPMPKPKEGFKAFEVGALVTLSKDEAEVGELVAFADMPESLTRDIELCFVQGVTLRLPGMNDLLPQQPAPIEIRRYTLRQWGPEFLRLSAWERVK